MGVDMSLTDTIEERIKHHYAEEQRLTGQLALRLNDEDMQAIRRLAQHSQEQARLRTQLALLRSWGL